MKRGANAGWASRSKTVVRTPRRASAIAATNAAGPPPTNAMSAAAEYVLTSVSIKADDKWYHTVFNGKDKALVWAGEAGDRSLMWGSLKRGGQRKVADRIVSKMKKDLYKN